MSKRIFLLILFLSLGLGVQKFCKCQTDGFTLSQIRENFSCEEVASSPPVDEVPPLLEQPFTYLGKGKQCFVFISQDKTHVLKIPNNRYQKLIAYYRFAEHLPFCASWAQKNKAYYLFKLKKTFASYQISYEELKKETGVVYTHLAEQKKATAASLRLIDKLGITHILPRETVAFLVQKKGKLFFPTLLQAKKEKDLPSAEKCITSFLQTEQTRCSKGISDNDPLLKCNFGFIGTEALRLDLGAFARDPSLATEKGKKAEMGRRADSLRSWLEGNYPELIAYLDQQLAEMLN